MNQTKNSRKVLILGLDPETVDFSDAALPPGLSVAKVHDGIAETKRQLAARGWQSDVCLIRPDPTAALLLERQLALENYDCVVIGAGVRLPPNSLRLFETLLNVVHRCAPRASIALNTSVHDTGDAVARWLTT